MNLNSLLSTLRPADLHLTWTLELFPSAYKALGVFCYTCTDFACHCVRFIQGQLIGSLSMNLNKPPYQPDEQGSMFLPMYCT